MTASVSVVIPTYFRYDCLTQLLENLSKQSRKADEVIVCDQTPFSDRPEGFYERQKGKFHEGVLIVKDFDRPSLAVPRNTGAKLASSEFVLFLDDDISITPDFIEIYLERILDRKVDVVTAATVLESKPLQDPDWINERNHPIRYFLDHPRVRWNGMCLVIHGGNTLIRRDTFLEVGGFDERFPRMEDHDLGFRLFRNGAIILYTDRPVATHLMWLTGGTRKTQTDMEMERLVSLIGLHLKHFPGWTTNQFVLRQVINSLLYRNLISEHYQHRHLLEPWRPFTNLWRLRCAHKTARQLFSN